MLLALAALGVVILLLVLGGIVGESGKISAAIGSAADKIQSWMQSVGVDSSAASNANANVSSSVPSIISTLLKGVASGIQGIASLAFGISFTLFSIFFLLKDGPRSAPGSIGTSAFRCPSPRRSRAA